MTKSLNLGEAAPEPSPARKSEARAGLREFFPLIFPIAAFGTMFGAASSAAGHSLALSVWASVAVFAGASQFVFLEVYSLGVPAWSVILAVFAVNFRHILYSAAITDRVRNFSVGQKILAFFLLTDLQFAVVENHHVDDTKKTPTSPMFYFVFGLSCYCLWIIATFFGALFGSLIADPTLIGLDFVLPIYFLSILMGFRKRANFYPVVLVSGIVAVLVQSTLGAPWHISIGALAGIATAVIASMFQATDSEQTREIAKNSESDDG